MTKLKREVRGLKQPDWDNLDVLEKLKSCVVLSHWRHLADDVLDAEAMTEQALNEAEEEIKRLRGELHNREAQVARLKDERRILLDG